MKKLKNSSKSILTAVGITFCAFSLTVLPQSCSEEINEGNFAVAKEQTVAEYLKDNPEFSGIYQIFQKVTLGRKGNASPLSSVLAARGNYTVFAPNNDALNEYVQNLLGAGKSIDDLSEEDRQLIAYSCILDSGNESAFEVSDFPGEGKALTKTDLNDRSITHEEKIDSSTALNTTYALLNGRNRVISSSPRLSNGYVHVLSSVIAPSNKYVSNLVKEAPNMRTMGELLTATGWDKQLEDYIDQDYEAEERSDQINLPNLATFNVAKHRYFGFTGFVETDDVFQREWNIPAPQTTDDGKVTNANEILAAIEAKAAETYGTEDLGNYTSSKNALNRFVAYHFMKGKLDYGQLVPHFNEWGYKYGDIKRPQLTRFTVDVWSYYSSMGEPRGLLKVLQDAKTNNIYLNRTCKYDVDKNYELLSVKHPGVRLFARNEYNGVVYDNNAKNGFFYPIDGILIADKTTSEALGSERIRIDVTTMIPELLSYGARSDRQYVYFPKLKSPRKDGTRGYFENIITETEDTRLLYLHPAAVGGTGWCNYQGDEFMVLGVYDFVLRLPPVPAEGMYEIRMGVSHNSLRGMCQIYFGDDPNKLVPAGLPYDMRQSSTNNPNIPWAVDTDDKASNDEIDKNLRNQGYMKGPKYFTITDGKGESSARAYSGHIRRIITTQYMKPGQTYYLRFKSALDKNDSQFFSDYIEFVPRSVYNGTEAEDIW